MGTTCRALAVGGHPERTTERAEATVARLEARWSRFLATSEVSRLNRAGGRPVRVAPETRAVIRDALAWWAATECMFDPTVLTALVAAGYDRDRRTGHGPIGTGAPAPGCSGIRVDEVAGTVQLPPGVGLDLGGIGKGWAADCVADELAQSPGGLVDLGGDLRVWGTPPAGHEGWPIAIEDLRDGSTLAVLGLGGGAVATSSMLRRAWSDGQRAAHHLIDPRTGSPTSGDLVSVTVVAGRCAPAEVLAKAALVAGSVPAAQRLLEHHGVAGLLVPARGAATPVGGFDLLCWTPSTEER
jgi:thiamine biosynthesis lipoprotein